MRETVFTALSRKGFYGWWVLGAAALGIFASGPGQSHTFSVFIAPISADLGVSPADIATAYAAATLIAAFGLPYMGRLTDRHGPRRMLLWIALALGAAGKAGAQTQMRQRYVKDASGPGELAERVADPGKAALAGLEAFSEGRYDAAFANLLAARPTMQTVGGSHAQRDVFERITIDAGLRAGHADAVEAVLDDRTARRAGRRDRFASTRYAKLGDMRRIPAQ